jgi:hypothetical protein
VRAALPVPLAVLLLACATGSPPDAQLAAARAMIVQAEPLGSRYAPAELRLAQAKLSAAEQAMAHEDWALARSLAEQAEVDAKYAWAIADAERSRSELETARRQ